LLAGIQRCFILCGVSSPRDPAGPSASVPNKKAQELALLKQPSPKKSIWYSGSAAPEGGKKK